MSNMNSQKRPLQIPGGQKQQCQSSLKPTLDANQNAITSYLQGQLEASQAKRRRLDLTTRTVDAARQSMILSKLKSMARGQKSGSFIGTSSLPQPQPPPLAQQSRTKLGGEAQLHDRLTAPQNQPPRKREFSDAKYYLHRVCSHFACNEDVVGIALTLDPQAVRRPEPGPSIQKRKRSNGRFVHASSKKTAWRFRLKDKYSFPINIAIQHGASMSVLELLVNQGPDVLLKKDGNNQSASLSIALLHKPKDLDLVDLIMFGNVQALTVADCRNNYPLHVACAKGATLNVLRRLYSHYPAALFLKNFHNETPLDIAQRCTTLVDEASLNFLQARFNGGCLSRISSKKECSRADAKDL